MPEIKDWPDIYNPLLVEDWMVKLRAKIKKERETKIILPEGSEVFKAFKSCPYDKLKVVIVDKEYSVTNDLTPLAEQGVLFLNRILTIEKDKPGSHVGYGWEQFTEKIIIHLSETYPKPIIFVFKGDSRKYFADKIDKKHFIVNSIETAPNILGEGIELMIQEQLKRNYFNELRTVITDQYDWTELAGFLEEWFHLKHILVNNEEVIKVLKFINGNICEFITIANPSLDTLYQINFKTS